MTITAALVKELRDRTNSPMMDCKRALQEANGDIEQAIENMRKSGAIKAAKKEGRITAEGVVLCASSPDKKTVVIIELNCETDFVARSDDFKTFAQDLVNVALAAKVADLPTLLITKMGDHTVEEVRQALIAKLGENVNIRRIELLSSEGNVSAYRHGDRIAVIVSFEGDDQLGKDLAMHIAASNPQVVAPTDVSEDMINKEKEIYMAQAAESGKPKEIIEKMVAGRISKFLNEVSLLGQPFVKDVDISIETLLKQQNGKVYQFVRFEVGEGIEKKVDNFVEEVLAQARGE
jgi:elongation factor Ts